MSVGLHLWQELPGPTRLSPLLLLLLGLLCCLEILNILHWCLSLTHCSLFVLQGRWWKKSVLATSSVVIIFSLCYLWTWLQSLLSMSSLNLEASQLLDFPVLICLVLHPFLTYYLTCLIADHWLSFQIKKSPHSQMLSAMTPCEPTPVTVMAGWAMDMQRNQGFLTPLGKNSLVNKCVPATPVPTGEWVVVRAYKKSVPSHLLDWWGKKHDFAEFGFLD